MANKYVPHVISIGPSFCTSRRFVPYKIVELTLLAHSVGEVAEISKTSTPGEERERIGEQ